MAFHPDWIVPDWPAPASVRAVFTTRAGGVSDAPWDTLNLGSHVGDDTAAVEANRERLRQAIGTRPVFLEQVHGTTVVDLDAPERAAAGSAVPEADGCTSATTGQACTIMVADCLPV
uniref:polyphenol oxidase family protein n=1 Tax=uncultured Xylophilus sp. TaxID=296832 RepID=UPI00260035E0